MAIEKDLLDDWCPRVPSSSATPAGCGPTPEFGSHGDLWVKMLRSITS